MCRPSSCTSGHCDFASNQARASAIDTPNLFSALPVEILAWVSASTSGLIRTEARAVHPLAAAMRWMASSSARDSTLKRAMPACSAIAISASVLPTPENTILSAGIPARNARCSSPPDTMSAPAPSSPISRSTAPLPLAFTA